MTAIDTAFALVIVGLLGCIGFFAWLGFYGMYKEAHPDEMALCAPSRRANITANTTPAPRRIVAELGRIDATYTVPFPLPAGYQAPQPAGDYAVPLPADVDVIRANSHTYRIDELAAPDPIELPLAVDDWPMPQTVVVGRTAARFASLEIGGQ